MMLAVEARTNQIKRERKLEAVRRIRAKPGVDVDVSVKLPRKDHAWMKDLTRALLDRWKDGAWRYGRAIDVPGGAHDMSIADHTERLVTMKDGLIESNGDLSGRRVG